MLEGYQTDNKDIYEISAKVDLKSAYDSLSIKANGVFRATILTLKILVKEIIYLKLMIKVILKYKQ